MFELIQLLYTFWPIILLALFIPQPAAKQGWFPRLRIRLRLLLVLWVIWAAFGITLLSMGVSSLGLILEPANSVLFIVTGMLAGLIYYTPGLFEYLRIHRAMSTAQDVADLQRLHPEEFEKLINAYFRQYGFRTQRIGRTGDHGIDLLIYTKQSEKWIVQCKRWRNSVGEPLVRELYGAMHHEQAQRAFLMTTGTITTQARMWAKGKPITLYDGEGLVRLLRRLQKTRSRKS